MDKEMKEKIRRFIKNRFMQAGESIDDHSSLFGGNVIDSFGMIELMAFIEEHFKITISPIEVTIENFDSINKIIELIKKKQNQTQK